MTYSCCTCSPYVHCMLWLTQYSRWDFLWDMGGVLQIWFSHHYLFIYLNLKKTSALVQVINYQLFYLLSLELNSRILESNSHFSLELLSCALGDLTMHNLTYKARLLEWQHQTVFGQYRISLIYLFFIFDSKFACFRLLPFILYCNVSISCCPWISGIS